jgi:HTH-type transcriptional regulator/antitoxin HipB
MRSKAEMSKAMTAAEKLAKLREQGLQHEGFREGYESRDALIRLGDMLRRVRESTGFTQEELAKKTGMTQPAISRLEAGFGRRGPELDTVMRFVHGCAAELVVSVKSASDATSKRPTAEFETAM